MNNNFTYEELDKQRAEEDARNEANFRQEPVTFPYRAHPQGDPTGSITRYPQIPVLDHGYVRFIEGWGTGDAGEAEAGIIEAARQSTQGSFRGWNVWHCNDCGQNFNAEDKGAHDGTNGADCPISKGWSNDEKLLAFMFNHNHSTPFEFAGMVIEVQATIFVIREWHRHRTQSYNEMSARYAPLPDMNYVPTKERLFLDAGKNKQAQAVDGVELTEEAAEVWLQTVSDFYDRAEVIYQFGLEAGIPKELARIVLPVGRYSRMRASANLRNWLGFVTLRAAPNAQWEIQQFANVVAEILRQQFPKTMNLFLYGSREGK